MCFFSRVPSGQMVSCHYCSRDVTVEEVKHIASGKTFKDAFSGITFQTVDTIERVNKIRNIIESRTPPQPGRNHPFLWLFDSLYESVVPKTIFTLDTLLGHGESYTRSLVFSWPKDEVYGMMNHFMSILMVSPLSLLVDSGYCEGQRGIPIIGAEALKSIISVHPNGNSGVDIEDAINTVAGMREIFSTKPRIQPRLNGEFGEEVFGGFLSMLSNNGSCIPKVALDLWQVVKEYLRKRQDFFSFKSISRRAFLDIEGIYALITNMWGSFFQETQVRHLYCTQRSGNILREVSANKLLRIPLGAAWNPYPIDSSHYDPVREECYASSVSELRKLKNGMSGEPLTLIIHDADMYGLPLVAKILEILVPERLLMLGDGTQPFNHLRDNVFHALVAGALNQGSVGTPGTFAVSNRVPMRGGMRMCQLPENVHVCST